MPCSFYAFSQSIKFIIKVFVDTISLGISSYNYCVHRKVLSVSINRRRLASWFSQAQRNCFDASSRSNSRCSRGILSTSCNLEHIYCGYLSSYLASLDRRVLNCCLAVHYFGTLLATGMRIILYMYHLVWLI